MIIRLTKYLIQTVFAERFTWVLSDYVQHSKQAAGNILAEAYSEDSDPGMMWTIERWSNRNLLDQHDLTAEARMLAHLANSGGAAAPQVIFLEDLEPLPEEAYRNVAAGDDRALTLMLFVDARPGTEDTFIAAYHRAMPSLRNFPGILIYQVCQVTTDRTQFYTYEKFRDEEAFQKHLTADFVAPLVDYLQTSIKQQPFGKGFHRLVPITRDSVRSGS